jgi:hypothetical protein
VGLGDVQLWSKGEGVFRDVSRTWGHPHSFPPLPTALLHFLLGAGPIWSQVNLWPNPAWKCCQLLSGQEWRLHPWWPPWSAVCGLPVFQKPQGARSQPGWPRLVEWDHLYKTLYSSHLALTVCGSKVFALNHEQLGEMSFPSLSKADS